MVKGSGWLRPGLFSNTHAVSAVLLGSMHGKVNRDQPQR